MKTSIIIVKETASGRLIERACLPDEDPEGKRVARYFGPRKERARWVGPQIHTRNSVFEVEPLTGGKVVTSKTRTAKVLSPEDAQRLHEYDEAIDRLLGERHAFMLEAAKRGRLLSRADCQEAGRK